MPVRFRAGYTEALHRTVTSGYPPNAHIDLLDAESQADGTRWWLELTESGGEGMVVKPHQFVVKGKKGLVQPAVKCRGREYLRIIYGPEYTFPENLTRLRERGLMTKRSLALREFALGVEALDRYRRQPFGGTISSRATALLPNHRSSQPVLDYRKA